MVSIQKISYSNYPAKSKSPNYYVSKPITNIPKYKHTEDINFGSWFWNKTKPELTPDDLGTIIIENRRNLTPHILCGGFRDALNKFEYSGSKKVFSTIKKKGKIDTIIYFGEPATFCTEAQQALKKANLKYFNLNIWNFDQWFKEDSDKISVKDEAFTKLKEFINILNSKDNIVMGCDKGIQRTSQALFFNYYLNPKKQSGQKLLDTCIGIYDYTFLNNFLNTKKLFDALSDKQKSELGITGRKLPKIEITDISGALKTLKSSLISDEIYK